MLSWEFDLVHDDEGLQCVDRKHPLPHLCRDDLMDLLTEEGSPLGFYDLGSLELTLQKPYRPRFNGWIKLKLKVVKDGPELVFEAKSKNSEWYGLSPKTQAWIEYNILPREKGRKEKLWIRFKEK